MHHRINRLVFLICATIAIAATCVRAGPPASQPSVEELRKRHAELAEKYQTPSGGVWIGRMTPAESKEYLDIGIALERARQGAKMPKGLKLANLPKIPAELASDANDAGLVDPRALLASEGSWQFVALFTETMIPLPRGWEIYEGGYETQIFFPPIHMRPEGAKMDSEVNIHIKFTIQTGKDFDELLGQMEKQLEPAAKAGIVRAGPKMKLAGGAGYLAIFPKLKSGISIVAVSPVPGHPNKCFYCLATFPESKWPLAQPVLEVMLQNWYALSQEKLCGDLKFPNDGSLAPATTRPANK